MITKTDACNKAYETHKPKIEQLVQEIDAKITRDYVPNATVSIEVGHYSKFVILEVMEMYRSAGWKIKEDSGSDQRDAYSWFKLEFS